MPQLTLTDSKGNAFALIGRSPICRGQLFPLSAGEHTVGRVAGQTVTIPDASVSRQHARLTVSGDGVSVEDLGSSNGTFVNNRRVTRATLSAGDRIRFGDVLLELQVGGEARATRLPVRAWRRFVALERPIRIAALLGIVTVGLLTTIVAITITRRARATHPSASAQNAVESVSRMSLARGS